MIDNARVIYGIAKANAHYSNLINLDNSGTFTGTHQNKIQNLEKKSWSASNSSFIVTEKGPEINNTITFNDIQKIKIYNNNIWTTIPVDNSIIKSNDITILDDSEIKINNKIININDFINKTHKYDKNKQISYHGYYEVNNNKVHALTINNGQFGKNFLLLTDTDFDNFVENKAATGTSTQSHAGGYQQKYLKYKQKYLQLKQMLDQQQ